MRSRLLSILLIVIVEAVLSTGVVRGEEMTLDLLLKKHIEALGGEELIRSLTTSHLEYEVEIMSMLMPAKNANLQAQEKDEALQWNCPTPTDITYPDSEKAMWDILFYFETTASSQGGVATDGNFIYTSSFSTEMFRKFTMDGEFLEEFTIPGISNCGCMTYDGEKFYGAKGNLSDGIFVLDLENHSLTNTIPVSAPSIIAIGHISYDPGLDNGNGGFWIGYWHELAAVDASGNEIIPNVVTGMPGIAGTAIDNVTDPDNPGLFCFQQTGSTDLEITKFDINSQTFSGVLHVATDIPGPSGGSSNSVASGMNSFVNNDGKLYPAWSAKVS